MSQQLPTGFIPVVPMNPAARRTAVNWFTRPVFFVLVILPIAIAFGAADDHRTTALLAYLNCLVAGVAAMYFVRQRSLQAMIPVLFLTWQTMSWPIACTFFAIFAPDASYLTMHYVRHFLDGGERLQLALLVFMICYLLMCRWIIRKTPELPAAPPANSRRMASLILAVVMVVIGLNAIGKVKELPFAVQYLADGLFIYLNGLMLVVGALLRQLPVRTILITMVFLAFCGVFYALGNARGMALLPFSLFVFGLLFHSTLTPRMKFNLVVAAAVSLPLYLAIADSTRRLLGGIGFENLERRAEALSRGVTEFLDVNSVFVRSLGRLFSTGGHSIITLTPESRPYMDFSPQLYFTELFTRLLPGVIYYAPHYSWTTILTDYDIRITDKTSVELSTVGSFWILGGWTAVAIGGLALGLTHALLANLIAGAARRSYLKGLFYLAMVGPHVLWCQNLDYISHFRLLVYALIGAVLIYQLVLAPAIGSGAPQPLRAVAIAFPPRGGAAFGAPPR
ncbi:MAG: hypothetical protein U1D55_17145 [Phycisphaerae bacterium]